jgi:cytidylate kinase
VALSREAGARGGTIGRRLARRLGWPVYDQELLEYMAQESTIQQNVFETLPPAAASWAEARLAQLQRREVLSQQPMFLSLVRLVLALGSQGRVVMIGRGAGNILPPESTLHARIVAPRTDRIAYMSQWLRLSDDEAAERVKLRDQRRADFLRSHFQCEPDDIHQYDVILNSSLLGEAVCVELLANAVEAITKAGLPKGRTATG